MTASKPKKKASKPKKTKPKAQKTRPTVVQTSQERPVLKTKPAWKTLRREKADKYTPALGDYICDELTEGKSLRSICAVARSKDSDFPDEKSVRRWAANPNHPFAPQYEAARLAGYMAMADELIEIADDGSNDWMESTGKGEDSPGWKINGEHVQRSRLRVDLRKWMLSKALPKVFGEQVLNKHTGADGGAIQVEIKPQAIERDDLAELMTRFGAPLKAIEGGKK